MTVALLFDIAHQGCTTAGRKSSGTIPKYSGSTPEVCVPLSYMLLSSLKKRRWKTVFRRRRPAVELCRVGGLIQNPRVPEIW